jgi:hypothetical protein
MVTFAGEPAEESNDRECADLGAFALKMSRHKSIPLGLTVIARLKWGMPDDVTRPGSRLLRLKKLLRLNYQNCKNFFTHAGVL